MTAGGSWRLCPGGCVDDGEAPWCPFGKRWARMHARYPQMTDGALLAVLLRSLGGPPRTEWDSWGGCWNR